VVVRSLLFRKMPARSTPDVDAYGVAVVLVLGFADKRRSHEVLAGLASNYLRYRLEVVGLAHNFDARIPR